MRNFNFSVSHGLNIAELHMERVSTFSGMYCAPLLTPIALSYFYNTPIHSIPLPEGLAPLSPKSLDADLDRIIERYTLLGISVLVHCRGGVGRAGLFACCWMLKLGLCGWIETDVSPSPAGAGIETEVRGSDTPQKSFRWDSNTVVRRDTLQLVERVIGVVRRRRSAKAIETLEQVQFLVEYVDYLRACGCAGEVSASVRKSDTAS
jgi:hypothetical protein